MPSNGRMDKPITVPSHNGCGIQKNVPLTKFHILIPRTCKYYLTWQKDCGGVIKLRVLRCRNYLDWPKYSQKCS